MINKSFYTLLCCSFFFMYTSSVTAMYGPLGLGASFGSEAVKNVLQSLIQQPKNVPTAQSPTSTEQPQTPQQRTTPPNPPEKVAVDETHIQSPIPDHNQEDPLFDEEEAPWGPVGCYAE